MSDLLSIGRSGVLAYQGALATIGENVTNADTAGYAKRTVVLKEATSVGGSYTLSRTSSAFGGVKASEVSRVWNQYQAANVWSANGDAGSASTRLQYLTAAQNSLDDSDNGLGTKLSAIFTSATQLAASPGDTSVRQTMLAAISDAATAINQTDSGLAGVAATARTQASTLVDQTNTVLAQIAKLNVALHTAAPGTASRAQLEDQRDNLLGTLSNNLALNVTIDADGAATVKLGDYSGPTLVASDDSSPAFVSMTSASDGRIALTVTKDGQTNAASPSGGALAGLIDATATIAGRRQQLNAIASKLATQLNTWQAHGITPAGTAGQPLITGTTAATIALATTDPAAIAAGSVSATDNGNLLALSSLRGTGGVEADWNALVTGHALSVSTAQTESDAAAARQSSAASALDETTGISLDTEAAQLLRYQQAYSASAKLIQTARQTLQDILSLF